MEIVIASHNMHKIRELRELFKLMTKHDVLSLLDFPNYIPPEQSGETFQEHAAAKAEHAARSLNKFALADDSSLVMPALGGVISKFYAGDEATSTENLKKLLKELEGKSELDRSAYYECCLALASPEGETKIFTGISEGRVAEESRGRNGFGYDSIFMKHDYEKTFGELDDTTRNRISHRRKAFEKLCLYLESTRITNPRFSKK